MTTGTDHPRSPAVATDPLAVLVPYLPEGFLPAIRELVRTTPCSIRVVRERKTKHGDYRERSAKGPHIITVNATPNPWQFAITLLHEIAHAQVAQHVSRRAPAHGKEWKQAFGNVLKDHLHLFPADLAGPLGKCAEAPLRSTFLHVDLENALRRYEAHADHPTVQDLEANQQFSLDGKQRMTLLRLMRKWHLCRTDDGRLFRVSPTARVHTLYA